MDWGQLGERIVESLRGHQYLTGGFFFSIIALIVYGIVRNASPGEVSAIEPIVIIGMLICVFLIAIALDYYRTRDPHVLADNSDGLVSKRVIYFHEGLELLIKAIEKRVKVQERIILLRVLPTEITTIFATPGQQNGAKAAISNYLRQASLTVKGGTERVDYWDETIIGHLKGDGVIATWNQKSWDSIHQTYFTAPQPDTTGLGISSDLQEWIFVVCTSSIQGREPDDYICALVLEKDKYTQQPTGGDFYIDNGQRGERYEIKKLAHKFLLMRDELMKNEQYWDIIHYNIKDWEAIRDCVRKFILHGEITKPSFGHDESTE